MMEFNKFFFKNFIYYPCLFFKRVPLARYQKLLQNSQFLSSEQIVELQTIKLQKIIQYSMRNVPYYAKAYNGVCDQVLTSLGVLSSLPIIDKTVLRNQDDSLLSKKRFSHLTKRVTGGTTGEHTVIWKDADALAQELAATWRGFSWGGIAIGDRQGRLWGVPHSKKDKFRSRLIDFMGHRKRCSAFAVNDEAFARYTAVLCKFKPDYLYGYLSMLEEYAEYFQRTSTEPPFQLKAIFSTSEVLSLVQREKIQKIFQTRVYNEYGSAELGTVAHECEYGNLHCSDENMIVEILDKSDNPCPPGEVGELVVTELNNKVMPLIRYRTNDFGTFSGIKCQCGRNLRVIDKLYGRGWDFITNKDGEHFHPAFFLYIMEDAKLLNLGVRGFQVVQEAVDTLTIRIVPSTGYGDSTEQYITERVRKDFSDTAELFFVKVDKIERLSSGKRQLVISLDCNDTKN